MLGWPATRPTGVKSDGLKFALASMSGATTMNMDVNNSVYPSGFACLTAVAAM